LHLRNTFFFFQYQFLNLKEFDNEDVSYHHMNRVLGHQKKFFQRAFQILIS
jgi:hypothetical protein